MDGPFLLVLSGLIFDVTKCRAAYTIYPFHRHLSFFSNSGQTGGLIVVPYVKVRRTGECSLQRLSLWKRESTVGALVLGDYRFVEERSSLCIIRNKNRSYFYWLLLLRSLLFATALEIPFIRTSF